MKWFKKMSIHQTITAITSLGVIGGALAAFRISFDNLTKEAQEHGIAADVAIFIPVIIDGFIVIFGIALLFFKSIRHAAGEKLSKQAIWGATGLSVLLNVTHTPAFKAWVDGVIIPPRTVILLQIVYASLPPVALAILFHAMTYIIEHGIEERDIVTGWKTRLQRARRGMASIRNWYATRLQAAETKRQELEIALQTGANEQQDLAANLKEVQNQWQADVMEKQQLTIKQQEMASTLQQVSQQLQAVQSELQDKTAQWQSSYQRLQNKESELAEALGKLQAVEKVLSQFGPEGLEFIRMVVIGDVNQSELASRMHNVSAPMLSKMKAACNGGDATALLQVIEMGHLSHN